ncbi:MAG TPA: adenylate/guanylate cyclase domain-containing protein [Chthoniobacterales bacterium]|jgi:TolB-like protein/class 3 adenylate cyclase
MPEEQKPKLRLEIAHVLFLDIVGYSKLLIDEQSEGMRDLNQLVRGAAAVGEAEAAGQLIQLPTGDGMALVFTQSPETAVECALQVSEGLCGHPGLGVRMGIHSGPVHHLADVNERQNIAGAGINLAQRVMDCGDAGHILVSKHVAEDLEHYGHWKPLLHDLGECEVKHGVRVHVFNLYDERVGNPGLPAKFKPAAKVRRPVSRRGKWVALAALAAFLVLGGVLYSLGLFSLGRKVAPREGAAALPAAVPDKSVAVLPFENLSSDPNNAFFADGVQDEILTDLAKIADLKVISRTSVMQYKTGALRNLREIGRQLGVAHLLEGSVQRAADTVRVNAQLINARTDAHEWAENYDRPLHDVFAIQSEIAKTIADQLQAKIAPAQLAQIERKPTSNLQAYDAYLWAQAIDSRAYDLSRKDRDEAIKYYRAAARLDPGFLQAWVGLARESLRKYFNAVDPASSLVEGRAAAEQAFALQPDSAEASLAQGYLAYYGEKNFTAATRWFEKALKLSPNDSKIDEALALISRRNGQWQKSVDYYRRAIALDPRNSALLEGMCDALFTLRDYPAVTQTCDRLLEMAPDDRWALAIKSMAFQEMGNLTAAAALLPQQPDDDPASFLAQIQQWTYERRLGKAIAALHAALPKLGTPEASYQRLELQRYLMFLYHDTGQNDAARATAVQFQDTLTNEYRDDPLYATGDRAVTFAFLGEKAKAIASLEPLRTSRDAIVAVTYAETLATIGILTGDKELALAQLAISARTTGGVDYGTLLFDPLWDPLRNDPRFGKIVASLKPKSSP